MPRHVEAPAPENGATVEQGPNGDAVTVIDVDVEDAREERVRGVATDVVGRSSATATEEVRRRDPHTMDLRAEQQEPRVRKERLVRRMQPSHERTLPRLISSPPWGIGYETRRSNSCSRSRNWSPPMVAHTVRQPTPSVSPLKPALETPEQQLEIYRSLQQRKFATLHEELHYLRMSYVHAQKTLRLRGEEVTRLHREVEDKSKDIERLKALLALMRKKRPQANEAGVEEEGSGCSGTAHLAPSLVLFAATAADDNNGERSATANLLMELRQNIAARDTVINNLRMELNSLRQAKRAADKQVHAVSEEVAAAHARCERLAADVSLKDRAIEDFQKRCAFTQTASRNGSTTAVNNNDNSGGTGVPEAVAVGQRIGKRRLQHRVVDNVIRDIQQQLHRIEVTGLYLPRTTSTEMRQEEEEEEEEGLRDESMRLRQRLDRGDEARDESEQLCRRRLGADLCTAEAELSKARAAVEAYKREVTRMQKQVVTAGFMEAQLQAARNENDALQQRVCELREENLAQFSREQELLSELRSTKEAHDRCEDEVSLLQRRMRASKENEDGLREEVGVLEGKLRAVERRDSTHAHRSDGTEAVLTDAPPPHELSSYATLMVSNARLQERLTSLEAELQQAREQSPSANAAADAAVSDKGSGIVKQRVARLVTGVAELKARLEESGAFLQQEQSQLATSRLSWERLRAEFSGVRDAYKTLSHCLDTFTQEQAEVGPSEAIAAEDTRGDEQAQHESPVSSAVRSRLRDVQRHALMAADAPEIIAALRVEVFRLCECLKEREEALGRTRRELVATSLELDNVRRQVSTFGGTGKGVGERKVSSLRAARVELEHWRQQATERELACEALRRQCQEQQQLIASLHDSLQLHSTPPSMTSDPVFRGGADWSDDHIIEEALRGETARLDEEMNVLRREVSTVKKERDHWKAVATGTP
ncbi:hypothetical protein TraAM80_03255 [Trypanosoma rangeli]|uniref:Uncharacterized protein n=1 Tax=Trypanosoma rangeli TaxID=5698 RepID=A0A3R7NTV0_TRYRA|nr:uncharacterized protein TraAM80_03255 [Trypanosoma rangeli]RNF07572.1 hypothetical protein TraAM80_03255 [Trypanosoma rangeli]|eukprot:RNF07572.1 hypothetical protein TraAM80_03255 [Trypanosoma rangeli]